MDYMLYIIAGLVFIILIAVLVMRKNKAQRPSDQPPIKADRTAPLSTHNAVKEPTTQASVNNDKKFVLTEIAQRFMDQQRYDKAIETLNRGLAEKPNDSQLTLKLLAVYATIDQYDDFNRVYDSIKLYGDAKSIAQADDLKALLTEEQNQAAARAMPSDNGQDAGFESIDFDLPSKKFENQKSSFDASLSKEVINHAEYRSDLPDSSDSALANSNNFDDIEQDFDLSLNDLEEDIDEPAATSVSPVIELDSADEENLSTSVTNDASDNNSEGDLAFDFDLDLDSDLPEQNNIATETAITTLSNDGLSDASNDTALDDEEFVLDLADLEIDSDDDNLSVNNAVAIEASQIEEDELALSLDSIDSSHTTATSPKVERSSDDTDVIMEDSLANFDDFDNFTLEDDAFEKNNTLENNSVEELGFEDANIADTETVASSTAPTTSTFDDNTLIDDNFDFESLSGAPTATTPVEVEGSYNVSNIDDLNSDTTAESKVETIEDFSARFAADFDFVKSLDNNQVTLDLASQYVQLGEYDSAKRLLSEVISQGNSEQQSQAQALLDRTA
ncbi:MULTISPECIES: FimV/HubP family polar landmark protein [unclassified Psychrobacter]|uniref:FimV/HubP family polar landmark protein n=1 Tax=unclassified Psychrobacter TaxID=196806 RepID=UPI0025E5AE92|nr:MULTISPECIES: FimV/HubP family polar landmark protein [unclassified Psychrobacter]